MRDQIKLHLATDPVHKGKFLVVVQSNATEHRAVLAGGLTKIEAHRLMLPLRRAFLEGIAWMREDVSSYTLSVHPEITCDLGVE